MKPERRETTVVCHVYTNVEVIELILTWLLSLQYALPVIWDILYGSLKALNSF